MFNANEIEAVQQLQPAYNKIQALLAELTPVFTKHFGAPTPNLQQDQKYLEQEGWFGIYKQGVLPLANRSTLFFGLGRARTCYKPWIGIYLRLTPSWKGLDSFKTELKASKHSPTNFNAELLSEIRENEQEWIVFFFQRLSYFTQQNLGQMVGWSSNLMQQMHNFLANQPQCEGSLKD